jgi:hypothetical protein
VEVATQELEDMGTLGNLPATLAAKAHPRLGEPRGSTTRSRT